MIIAALITVPCAAAPVVTVTIGELEQFAQLLIKYGRDTYGRKTTPLFVSQLDVAKRRLPPADTGLYGPEDRGGAGPTTNNLQFDSGLIRLVDALSEVTGNSAYRDAVDVYLAYYLRYLPNRERGFFPWGDHRGYDLIQDITIMSFHEFKVVYPPWERLYSVNAAAVRRSIESLQLHIYEPSRSWAFSRHYPPTDPLPHSMSSSAGAYIAAWSFLYTKTGEEKYLEWAQTLANYLWSLRAPETNLLASHPYDPAYPEMLENVEATRRASRTEYMEQYALYAPNLLIAAKLLGPEDGQLFQDQALAYLRAFTTRMAPLEDGSVFVTFDLKTGKPLFPRITGGWHYEAQEDAYSNWENTVLPLRAPLTAATAAKFTEQPDFIADFDRLRPLLEIATFADAAPRRELPAGLIAQTISAYLDMYQVTEKRRYLENAATLGRYARKHYFVKGWIVCGPPILKRYQDSRVDTWKLYSNRGGSPELGLALLRLILVANGQHDFIEPNPLSYF